MLGSLTTPGRLTARDDTTSRIALQVGNPVGTRVKALSRLNGQPPLIRFAAQAHCRRFDLHLTEHDARLGGDVTRYVFIVEDLRLLLLAGLPAHYQWP